MARPRLIPDENVFALIRAMLAQHGHRHVTFAAVAARTGLAGPSLVQRYGSRDRMVLAALLSGWEALERATDLAIATTPDGLKGALALLKAIAPSDPALPPAEIRLLTADLADPALRVRAATWREKLVHALAAKLGHKGLATAEMLFDLWQGRFLWSGTAAPSGFRMRDAARLLTAR